MPSAMRRTCRVMRKQPSCLERLTQLLDLPIQDLRLTVSVANQRRRGRRGDYYYRLGDVDHRLASQVKPAHLVVENLRA